MENDDIRDAASDILQDPDFQQYEPKQEEWDFWEWLRELLDFDMPRTQAAGDPMIWKLFWQMLVVLAVLLALAALVYLGIWIYRRYFKSRPVPEALYGIVSEQERMEAREAYARLAQDALKAGDYRRAMHYLLLASVSMVIRDALFHGTDCLTNRELAAASDFSRFANAEQLRQMFYEMVHYDEPRWFGLKSISEGEYQEFHQVYQRFQQSLQSPAEALHA